MKYYTLHNSDRMPALGMGTFKSGVGEVYQAVIDAVDIGFRHFDCSPYYGNEKEIGSAIADLIYDNKIKREDLWITSKLWCNAHKKSDVRPALEKTLSDLELDYLDLYLIHWPVAFRNFDIPDKVNEFISLDEIPLTETWKAMLDVKQSGLINHAGVSNFSIKKLEDLKKQSLELPEVNQIEMHPYLRQQEMLDFCCLNNILITAYSPLGTSSAARKLLKRDEVTLLQNDTIYDIAIKHKCTPAQVILKWSLDRGISVIPKSVNKSRMLENINCLNLSLDETDRQSINELDIHFRFVDGKIFTPKGSPYTSENLWDE